MMIRAKGLSTHEINSAISAAENKIDIVDCFGERFIGCGSSGRRINITGTPGNALGADLDGSEIVVKANTQDAVGDTMNDGTITIYGNAGDALGYAMRGGRIFVRDDSGYRTGIHMKEYGDKKPVIVVGGRCGSFLGEYLAGGLIIVLGIGCNTFPAGFFTGTGMHGGSMFIRSAVPPAGLPEQVIVKQANQSEMSLIKDILKEFCSYFDISADTIYDRPFYMLTSNSKNPYKQLYTEN